MIRERPRSEKSVLDLKRRQSERRVKPVERIFDTAFAGPKVQDRGDGEAFDRRVLVNVKIIVEGNKAVV